MQFPSLFATNKFSRIPTPKVLLKPSLPFNLNLWYPLPIFCVPNSSEYLKFLLKKNETPLPKNSEIVFSDIFGSCN